MYRSASTALSATEVVSTAGFDRAIAPAGATWRRVQAAFGVAINAALEAALRIERDPQAALHEFRRAIRHARAIVAACHALLAPQGRLELNATLRQVTRMTGAMRDRDALPAALAELPVEGAAAEARASLEARLLVERLRARQPLLRLRKLAVAAAKLSLLPARLETLLPPRVSTVDLGKGLKRLAKRAHKAVRSARLDPVEVEPAHAARKRLRTLANALSLLAKERTRTGKPARRAAKLSRRLGATLDYQRLAKRAGIGVQGAMQAGSGELLALLEREAIARRPRLLARADRLLARGRLKELQ